ncbi:MAG: hypothetical protein WKF76_11635 [Nocardioidaceae bacterium]
MPRWGSTRTRVGALAAALAVVLLVGCTHGEDPPAGTDTSTVATTSPTATPEPPRWVVSVGDSYISGEGARWAGNTTRRAAPIDALGPAAYDDRPGEESQPGCHRAQESIATLHLPNVRGKNLACSGATTRSSGGLRFKPGLDFYRDADGNRGQALALQRFARTHDVSHVVVSIGGNDFGFGPVVAGCALGFLGLFGRRQPCSADPDVTAGFSEQQAHTVREKIGRALDRVTTAMTRVGYTDDDYRLVVLSYPSPLPTSGGVRYRRDQPRYDVGAARSSTRTSTGPTTWRSPRSTPRSAAPPARSPAPKSSASTWASALDGHRLCEQGVDTFLATGLRSWESEGAATALEWVNRIYLTLTPWQVQESLHPNYWGMRAEQRCVELVISEQMTRGVVGCRPAHGLTSEGTPAMRLSR